MNHWDQVRTSFERGHSDLFEQDRYLAEFYNYMGGSWDPDADEFTGESRESIGTANIEIVPPGMDATVENDGTSLSWDTSIRFPEDESITSEFIPLGENSDRPTEVEIQDTKTNSTELYELHGYTTELGSGFIMCRLVEQ